MARFLPETSCIIGEQMYDGLIAATARHAQVTTLLTFKFSQFMTFAGPDLEVKVPGF